MTTPNRSSRISVGWLAAGLAVASLAIAARAPHGTAAGADPHRPAGQARLLGTGGTYSNHTVNNTLPGGLDATGWRYRLYGISAGQVITSYNGTDNPFTSSSLGTLEPAGFAVPVCIGGIGCPDTSIPWTNTATGRTVAAGASAHFGFELQANFHPSKVTGVWTGVNSMGTTVEATVPANTLLTFLEPAVTPTPTSPRHVLDPLSQALPMRLAASDPPFILARIENSSLDVVIVERFYKVLSNEVPIRLEDLIAGTDLVKDSTPVPPGPVELRTLDNLDFYIDGVDNNNQSGVLFWYTARALGSDTIAYEAYHAIKLTADDPPTLEPLPTPTPTPTPTRRRPYFPYVLRDHHLRPTVPTTPTPTP